MKEDLRLKPQAAHQGEDKIKDDIKTNCFILYIHKNLCKYTWRTRALPLPPCNSLPEDKTRFEGLKST